MASSSGSAITIRPAPRSDDERHLHWLHGRRPEPKTDGSRLVTTHEIPSLSHAVQSVWKSSHVDDVGCGQVGCDDLLPVLSWGDTQSRLVVPVQQGSCLHYVSCQACTSESTNDELDLWHTCFMTAPPRGLSYFLCCQHANQPAGQHKAATAPPFTHTGKANSSILPTP